MKFLALIFAVFALIGTAVGLKNAICDQEHSKNGNGVIKCEAFMPSFSWDGKQCVYFVYGGCGGNENRFGTKAECEQRCKEAIPS